MTKVVVRWEGGGNRGEGDERIGRDGGIGGRRERRRIRREGRDRRKEFKGE